MVPSWQKYIYAFWRHSRDLGMSFRHLKNIGFANLEDTLQNCLKGIPYSSTERHFAKTSFRYLLKIDFKTRLKNALKDLCKMIFRRLKNVGFANLEDILHSFLKTIHSSNPPPPPPLQRGRIDFLKFGNKGGDKIIFLEREGLD